VTFPNEYEGNIYDHNWSLCEDGVIPVGNAYVNARVDLLKIKSGVKKGSSGAIAAEAPLYAGKYTLKEAGATISQDDFNALFKQNKTELSSGADLFVEDAALGSYSKSRVGVRVVTQDPKMALIARTLLVRSTFLL
jgi:ATP-dependent phosphoenolpyruvate carboxykinase